MSTPGGELVQDEHLEKESIRDNCGPSYIYLFIYLFTSFSEHRPSQRECARKGLKGPMQGAIPAHIPHPQPVKVGHTTGVYDP